MIFVRLFVQRKMHKMLYKQNIWENRKFEYEIINQ